jgi:hypothetical protein
MMIKLNNAWVELIARVCHEANIAIQIHADEEPSPNWDLAPSWQKESAKDGVISALAGKTPEQLHESWCDFKKADGWIYGPVKSEEAKTHPCLVPYDELPAVQQLKDHIFNSIVRSFRHAKVA